MRLYLSSFGLGNRPQEMLALLPDRAKVAIIANAADHKSRDGRLEAVERERSQLGSLGLEASEIDLRAYFGKGGALIEALSGFDLLWVRGGNVFNLRRALRQSGGDHIIIELLKRDALVYAGYSAGPSILTPSLEGCELVDPPQDIPCGYDSAIIWEGLGLVPFAIAPHYKSDHPESEAVNKLVEYYIDRHVPFKALRDGEAIVVNGAKETVVS